MDSFRVIVPRHEDMARWNLFDSSVFWLPLTSGFSCSARIFSLTAKVSILNNPKTLTPYGIPYSDDYAYCTLLRISKRDSVWSNVSLSVNAEDALIARCGSLLLGLDFGGTGS